MLKIGDKVPEFWSVNQSGEQFSLERFKNSPVVLVFLGGNLGGTLSLLKLLEELAPKILATGSGLVAAVGSSMSPYPLSEFVAVRKVNDEGITLLDDSRNGDLAELFLQPDYQAIDGNPVFMGNYSPLVVLSADHTIAWMSSKSWMQDFDECTSKILAVLER